MSQIARLPRVQGARAVIYLRQSTYREESISLEVQEQAARDYCARMGYTVVTVEADPGISGRTWQRQGVQNAMAALEQSTADVVVLWRWSRLSRSRRDWAIAADRADLAGGRIESATEPNDATAAGRFGRGIMVELAAFESERIGEQWRETHEHRVRQGLPPTGGPRFGYAVVEGRYEPDPVTGPVVAELYRLYLGGMGAAQLTRYVNERGHARGQKPWTYQGVMNVLDSGFAAGLLGRVRPKRLPVWERRYEPGIHPPIIDVGTWEAYKARRASRYRQPVRSTSPYLLSGLTRCGDCGGPMHGKRMEGKQTYVCSRASVTTGVRKVSITAWRVDQAVEEWVLSLASEVEQIADAREGARVKQERAGFTTRSAERRLTQANDRLTTLTLKLADGTLTDAAYHLAAASVEADRAGAEAQLREATTNPVEAAAPHTLSNDLVTLWPRMTTERRNLLLRPLLAYAEVAPALHRGSIAPRVTIRPTWDT